MRHFGAEVRFAHAWHRIKAAEACKVRIRKTACALNSCRDLQTARCRRQREGRAEGEPNQGGFAGIDIGPLPARIHLISKRPYPEPIRLAASIPAWLRSIEVMRNADGPVSIRKRGIQHSVREIARFGTSRASECPIRPTEPSRAATTGRRRYREQHTNSGASEHRSNRIAQNRDRFRWSGCGDARTQAKLSAHLLDRDGYLVCGRATHPERNRHSIAHRGIHGHLHVHLIEADPARR
jgi:hypothetical protein